MDTQTPEVTPAKIVADKIEVVAEKLAKARKKLETAVTKLSLLDASKKLALVDLTSTYVKGEIALERKIDQTVLPLEHAIYALGSISSKAIAIAHMKAEHEPDRLTLCYGILYKYLLSNITQGFVSKPGMECTDVAKKVLIKTCKEIGLDSDRINIAKLAFEYYDLSSYYNCDATPKEIERVVYYMDFIDIKHTHLTL